MSLKQWLVRPRLTRLAILTAAIAVAAMSLQALGAHGLALANGQAVFGDFLAFWSAGRLTLEGRANEIYSISAIAHAQHAEIPGLTVVFPWRHPPMFLLIAAPFAILPFPIAALTFLALTAALYLYAALRNAPDPRDLVFAATMPVAVMHLGSVQVGLLVAALSLFALAWLDRRPLAAGACIGLLAIKPHLALFWPVFLAIEGRWRTFFAAAAAATAFTLLAGLVFGFDLFEPFFRATGEGMQILAQGRSPSDTLASLYANLLGLGLPSSLALTLHALSALAAIAFAVAIWRKRDWEASVAALAAATLLLSPYLFFYDQTLLIIAVGALYRRATPREAAWLAFAWAAGALSLSVGKLVSLPVCPLAAWAALIIAAARVQVLSRRQTS
jgi:hypothetical protein